MNDCRCDLHRFLRVLFEPADTVEIRPIEIWTDVVSKRRHSSVLHEHRMWLTPHEIADRESILSELNTASRANVFMGVNPRAAHGGSRKSDVRICRSVWVDMDDVTPESARWRCHITGLPDPSLLVDSGSGVHLYWILREPVCVSTLENRRNFEVRLKMLYQRLRADSTNDVTRLLRLPGFKNMKDARNGAETPMCRLVWYSPDERFELDRLLPSYSASWSRPRLKKDSMRQQDGQVGRIIARLDRTVTDRSRRDFGVICCLIRIGVRPEEIWRLVKHCSKFATAGRSYFETTIANAFAVCDVGPDE